MFATNFFDSLDFLNQSLINNKRINVSNKHSTETVEDNTPPKSVKKVKKRHKRKSSSEQEELFVKQITSVQEKKNRHKNKSIFEETGSERISVQNDENVKVVGETIIKERKKKYKNKSALKELDVVSPKNRSPGHVKSKRHKTLVESVLKVANSEVSDEECNKGMKKKGQINDAFLKPDPKNIIQNEENVDTEDIINIIKKVKDRYERKSFSTEDEKSALNQPTNYELMQKKHKKKSAFDKHVIENISIQNEAIVNNETVLKEKKKKHKECYDKDNDTSLTESRNSMQKSPAKKKKKHKRKNSETAVDNSGLLENENINQENPVKKKKKHTRELFDIEHNGASSVLENVYPIQENVKKRKKHKKKLIDVLEDQQASLSENISKQDENNSEDNNTSPTETKDSMQEIHVKKKKKHKSKLSVAEENSYPLVSKNNSEDNDTSPTETRDSMQESHVKKKKHKSKLSEAEEIKSYPLENENFENNDIGLTENRDSMHKSHVKKKKHTRKVSEAEDNSYLLENEDILEDNDTSLTENRDSMQKSHVKKKKNDKRKLSEAEEDNSYAVENENYIPVKKKKKHTREFFNVEHNDANILENLNSIQEDVEKRKKPKKKLNDVLEDQHASLLESIPRQDKNNFEKEDFTNKKPNKVKKQKFKLFSQCVTDGYFAGKNYANLETTNKKASSRKGNSTNVDLNNQSHNTHNDSDLQHIFDKKIKEEIEDIDSIVAQNANLETTSKKARRLQGNSSNGDLTNQSHNTLNDTDVQHTFDQKKIKEEVEDIDSCVAQNADEEFADVLRNSQATIPSMTEQNELLNTTMISEEDDELLSRRSPVSVDVSNLDTNEDPVEFEIPLLHSRETVLQVPPEEREALKSQGIIVKQGRYSDHEDSLLRRNYHEFTKRFGVDDPQILLGISTNKHRDKEVLDFLKAKHFYARLGRDLNDRPLYNIYRRARVLFNPCKRESKLNEENVNRIKKAHSRMGSKWQKIGNIIEHSAETTRQAFLWHDKPVNRGNWTEVEESQLSIAIRSVTGIEDLSSDKIESVISWERVADLVPTRNASQCRLHWFEKLSCKYKTLPWIKKDYVKLVTILRKYFYVKDSLNVNWKEVQKCFGDISWQFLRKKWYHLVKMYRKLNIGEKDNFQKMLDHFCIKYKIEVD